MEEGTVRFLAQVLSEQASVAASQARVAGMIAENTFRDSVGQTIAYAEDAFSEEETICKGCAARLRGM
jgi:hypothetical protein